MEEKIDILTVRKNKILKDVSDTYNISEENMKFILDELNVIQSNFSNQISNELKKGLDEEILQK